MFQFQPSVRHFLKELPDSLDEIEERILREIRRPNQVHAHRLLHSMSRGCCSPASSLRVEELAEVLAFVIFPSTQKGPRRLSQGWR